MDVNKKMNDKQQEAINTTEGPLLILAGAGSGKTTVLVSRIAHIVELGLAKPYEILAITFTNKAANELKERIALYVGEEEARDIWAGTFHSICARILRRSGAGLGYSSHFTIYDTDDSKRIMKECQRLLNIDDKILPHKTILSAISKAKDELISPEEYAKQVGNDPRLKHFADCYKLYQQLLKSADAMDFDDIIVNTVKLLETDKDVREYYQAKFKYVHVDEYQDTNHAQYVLTSLLAGHYNNICVVGDDDQSIYKFRGATIENIMDFEKHYKHAKLIRLEQNYRSTGNILNAANAVIKNNKERKGKNLWTEAGDGELITLYTAESEIEEGVYIADEIMTDVDNGANFSDHAILYRTNAQSNAIERAFVRMGVPYKVVGGKRFYERKEIRDALAYLTLLINPSDAIKLRRVINEPKRGIGDATVNVAADIAAGLGISIFEVMMDADQYDRLSRAANKLIAFTNMINGLREKMLEEPLPVLFDDLLDATDYVNYLKLDKDTFDDRLSNLQELKTNMIRYLEENEDGDLEGFLEEVSLMSDIDAYNEQADVVVMMTLHSAKGLEFPVVFMTGMEEGLFPGRQSMYDSQEIEEERRLAYVGITRAKKKLYMTNAQMRMMFGQTGRNPQSRFVEEVPQEYFKEPPQRSTAGYGYKGYSANYKKPSFQGFGGYSSAYSGDFGSEEYDGPYGDASKMSSYNTARKISAKSKPQAETVDITYKVGDTVTHKAFGTGVVLSVSPMGNDNLVEVAFDKAGTKKLMANYAKLEKV
ncbi:MAG: UvrD-helicase domain-containing protein [Clostridia bacterium]|nr:UvrD-helicase domain-containing protein [Clostridia bacterium]